MNNILAGLLLIISIAECAVITYDNLDFECSDFKLLNPNVKLSRNETDLNDIYLNFYHKVSAIHSKKNLFNNEEVIVSKYYCKNKSAKHFPSDERLIDLTTNKVKLEKLGFLFKVLSGPIVSTCVAKTNEVLEINIHLVERKPKGFKLKFNLKLVSNNVQKKDTFYEQIKFYGCASLVTNQPYYFKLNSSVSLNCSELTDPIEFIKRDPFSNVDHTLTSGEKYQIENNVLKINSLDESDFQSNFECVSQHYKINRKFNLHPYIKQTKIKSKTILEGSSIELKCEIMRPAKSALYELRWYKLLEASDKFYKKIRLENNTNVLINLGHDNFKLKLDNFSHDDVGTYVCSIKNEYGEFSREFQVKIYDIKILIIVFVIVSLEVVLLSVLFLCTCK